MTTFILSIAVAALSLATGDTPESERDKYQGTWVLVSEEFEGRKVPAAELAEDLKDLSYTIRGNRLLFIVRGEERSATIKLDPSQGPKNYDLVRDGNGRSSKASTPGRVLRPSRSARQTIKGIARRSSRQGLGAKIAFGSGGGSLE